MNLLITLGHNSSAILVDNNGNVINGVEEERLSRIKSDSSFPKLAISHVMQNCSENLKNIFISHWFDDYDFIEHNNDGRYEKYFDKNYFTKLLLQHKNCQVITLNEYFTHHNAHAMSALAFYKNFCSNEDPDCGHIIVADGFGNREEVISIYEFDDNSINNIKKVYGYKNSLGLLYQYATTYCGMKAHKDEWKYLAYESHIEKEFDMKQIETILLFATQITNLFIHNIFNTTEYHTVMHNSVINQAQLEEAKCNIHNTLDKLVTEILIINDKASYKAKVAVGFFIQTIIENVLKTIIKKYNIETLLVAGGLFYNVKLNNCCLNEISGKFSVIPLAGDQGAAIGLYYNTFKKFNFGNLCWSDRNLTKKYKKDKTANFILFDSQDELVKKAIELLLNDCIVQVVLGRGEYGPRALCHTSSLFLPQKYNADINDIQNNRLSLMPLAPVILERNREYFFEQNLSSKVVGSDKYMIITFDYKATVPYEKYNGVMHKYPLRTLYSGRPQIVTDNNFTIYKILDILEEKTGIKALVNTSFNIHSEPIVFSIENATENFDFQKKACPNEYKDKSYLLIGNYIE